MNITELKELAEKATPGPWKAGSATVTGAETDDSPSLDAKLYGGNGQAKARNARYIAAANPAAILELITQLEDAQGENRALRATEAGLREKADRWDFLAPRMLAADFDYLGDGVQALVFEMPNGFSASADAADTIDRARALLEKKE